MKRASTPGRAVADANPTGSNILRRLGIDENLDYSKPLTDPLKIVNTPTRAHYQRSE